EPAEALAAEAPLGAAEVVLLALLGVGEHVVRVRHRLEPLGCLGTGVHVGGGFARQAAIRLLDLGGGGGTRDAEDLVVVCHGGRVLSIAGCRGDSPAAGVSSRRGCGRGSGRRRERPPSCWSR